MREKFEMSESELDAELASTVSLNVAQLVRALPDEAPSMVWRSELNASIQAAAANRTRLNRIWIWKPMAGLALCGVLAFAFILRQPTAIPSTVVESGIEQALVRNHVESFSSMDLAGVGVTNTEAKESASRAVPDEWEQEDITSAL